MSWYHLLEFQAQPVAEANKKFTEEPSFGTFASVGCKTDFKFETCEQGVEAQLLDRRS